MKTIVAILVISALSLSTLPAYGQEKLLPVSVDRSPFYEAGLRISGGRDDDEIQKDARRYDKPPGTLMVEFFQIAKDRDRDNKPIQFLYIAWEDVTIGVDTSQKGMTISYTRHPYIYRLDKLVLTVPSEADQKLWTDIAELRMRTYRDRFFTIKEVFERQKRKAEEREKAVAEALKEPRVVYPR